MKHIWSEILRILILCFICYLLILGIMCLKGIYQEFAVLNKNTQHYFEKDISFNQWYIEEYEKSNP